MVKDNSQDFGECAVRAIREFIQQNNTTWSKLNGSTVAIILQKEFDSFTGQSELRLAPNSTLPLPELGGARRTRAKSTERNPLFDALALSTGCRDLSEITDNEAKAIGVALSQIKRASPDLTPQEIDRRALCYKRAHRDWPLTSGALAKHWSEFSINDHDRREATLDPYKTPDNWRDRFYRVFPGIEAPAEWAMISVPLRSDILRKTS